MKVSTAQVNIAPHGTFYMEGYVNEIRHQPALGIHDDPQAILLLMEEDGERVLFCSVDVCILTAAGSRPLREGLAAALAMPEDRIVISCTHTHSCPTGFEAGAEMIGEPSHGWAPMVSGRVTEAATGLPAALTEVRAEIARTHVRGWYGNRNDRERPFDDEAAAVRFLDDAGAAVAAMLHFSCHATVVGSQNRYLTTDLAGAVRELAAGWLGVTPYTFAGAQGDLGNRQYRRGNGFEELARVSVGVAGEIMRAPFEPVDLRFPTLRRFHEDISYDNTVHYAAYREQLDEIERRLAGPHTAEDEKFLNPERDALLRQLETERVEFPLDMVTIDMGPLVLVTFPGELANGLGLRIKGMFGEGRVVEILGYANDYQGYFVPEEDYGSDYESLVSKLPAGGIERVLDRFEEQL